MPALKENPRYNLLSVRVDDRTALVLDRHLTANALSLSDYLRQLISNDLEAHNGEKA